LTPREKEPSGIFSTSGQASVSMASQDVVLGDHDGRR
jgi:hypothetical protein